jgi:hypothetical protein
MWGFATVSAQLKASYSIARFSRRFKKSGNKKKKAALITKAAFFFAFECRTLFQ